MSSLSNFISFGRKKCFQSKHQYCLGEATIHKFSLIRLNSSLYAKANRRNHFCLHANPTVNKGQSAPVFNFSLSRHECIRNVFLIKLNKWRAVVCLKLVFLRLHVFANNRNEIRFTRYSNFNSLDSNNNNVFTYSFKSVKFLLVSNSNCHSTLHFSLKLICWHWWELALH